LTQERAIGYPLDGLRLEFLAGLESDGFAGRNISDFSRSRVASNAAFARLDDEYAKAAQLDSLAALQRALHRVEQRFDGRLCFCFWDACFIGNLIDYIKLDHFSLRSQYWVKT
jgi:hypothetical protein